MRKRPGGLTDRLRHTDDDAVRRFLENAERHLSIIGRWFAKNADENLVVFDSETRGAADVGSLVEVLGDIVDRP